MTKKIIQKKEEELVIYQTKSGALELRGDFTNDTVWASQAQMAEVFGVNSQAVTKHIKNIYKEAELVESATCSILEQVQTEGGREITRSVKFYNLDVIIAVGYRINSVVGTNFRIWATKTLRQHITQGYTINPKRVAKNYDSFMAAVKQVQAVLPAGGVVDTNEVLNLVRLFADTWFSLDAYDKETLAPAKMSKRKVRLTAKELQASIAVLKQELIEKREATENFAQERNRESVEGIVGNVMQSFAGQDLYPTVESKAAHLLYFIIKNHPFVDGNKRSGAYAFVWFLHKARVLNTEQLTPTALTALTILIAESNSQDKDKMTSLVMMLISRR